LPWVRFDDQFTINRKVARLSDAAYRLHSSAIFWCARNLTDGVVPEEDLEDVCARVRTPERFVTEIVGRGLWHPIGFECDSEHCPAHPDNAVSNGVTGWVIHDYLEYQPPKRKVQADRKANAERQKKWREQRKRQAATASDRNGVSNAVSNRGSNTTPSRPGPVSTADVDGGLKGSQSVNAHAREAEALDWLHRAYGLTDEEARVVWATAKQRAPKEIKNPVRYLEGMIENGSLATIVEAVYRKAQGQVEPPPEPEPYSWDSPTEPAFEPRPPRPLEVVPTLDPAERMDAFDARDFAHIRTCKTPQCARCEAIRHDHPEYERSATA